MGAFVGSEGQKMEMKLTYVRRIRTTTQSYLPYNKYDIPMYGHVFKTHTGETVMWWTTSTALPDLEAGHEIIAKFTVKKHSVYKGDHQTMANRLKVVSYLSSTSLSGVG